MKNYFLPNLYSVFSNKWKKFDYGRLSSSTSPALKVLNILDMFDIEYEGNNVDIRNRIMRDIDEHSLLMWLVKEEPDNTIYLTLKYQDSIKTLYEKYMSADTGFGIMIGGRGVDYNDIPNIFSHLGSSFKEFSSNGLEDGDILFIISTAAKGKKLGKIYVTDSYYIVNRYDVHYDIWNITIDPTIDGESHDNKSNIDLWVPHLSSSTIHSHNHEHFTSIESIYEFLHVSILECQKNHDISTFKKYKEFIKKLSLDIALCQKNLNVEDGTVTVDETDCDVDGVTDEQLFKYRLYLESKNRTNTSSFV